MGPSFEYTLLLLIIEEKKNSMTEMQLGYLKLACKVDDYHVANYYL